MSVLFAENFRGYASQGDPAFISMWSDERELDPYIRIYDQDGEMEFANASNIGENFPSALIHNPVNPGLLRVVFYFSGNIQDHSLFLAGGGDRHRAIESGKNAPIRIDHSYDGVLFSYTIYGPSGDDSDKNIEHFETGWTPVAGTVYRIEIEIDHRSSLASAKVIVNGGSILNVTYDRDDVGGMTAEPLTDFGWIGFGPRNAVISNVVVWDDDGSGLTGFPAGPLVVETLNTPTSELQGGPVTLNTNIQYDTATYTQYDVADPADQNSTIYATFVEVRSSSSDGTEPSTIGVKADVGAASAEFETLTYPGLNGAYDRVKITDSASMADLNAATISLRRAP